MGKCSTISLPEDVKPSRRRGKATRDGASTLSICTERRRKREDGQPSRRPVTCPWTRTTRACEAPARNSGRGSSPDGSHRHQHRHRQTSARRAQIWVRLRGDSLEPLVGVSEDEMLTLNKHLEAGDEHFKRLMGYGLKLRRGGARPWTPYPPRMASRRAPAGAPRG